LEKKHVTPLRLIADDITPEALTSLLSKNKGIMTIISTEGGFFDTLAGRYASKNVVSIDTVLKAHCGDMIAVDRQGRASEFIENPILTMLLTAQEQVLEGLLANEHFVQRGLTARFLYCRPTSKIGNRTYETPEIPSDIEREYNSAIYSLLKIPVQKGRAKALKLDDGAYAVIENFHNWLEPRLAGDLGEMNGWCEKLLGTILRIAGILHCIENIEKSADVAVTENTMKNAVEIGKYFLRHAKYTFALMGSDKTEQGAKHILKKLEQQDERALKKGDIFRMCRKYKNTEAITPYLDLLIDMGYLRHCKGNRFTGGAPDKGMYLLNPIHFDK
jgi:hypothetical protein